MKCDWQVGEKIVCLEDYPRKWKGEPGILNFPSIGAVYTIREILADWNLDAPHMIYVRLVEIVNPIILWDDGDVSEAAWYAHDFRRVAPRRESIEALERLVRSVPVKLAIEEDVR